MTSEQQRTVNASGLVFGAMVMLVGTVFLLNQLDIIRWRGVWQFWPLLLIGLGIAKLLEPPKDGTREGGFLVFIGLWLLGNQTGLLSWRDSWPLIVIAVGISIVWKALTGRPGVCPPCRPSRPHRPSRPGQAASSSSSEEPADPATDAPTPGPGGQSGSIARLE